MVEKGTSSTTTTTTTSTTTMASSVANNNANSHQPHHQQQHQHHITIPSHIRLSDIKRLPVDISEETIMDPVNIPSKLKMFQASSNDLLFGYVQYNLTDALRVSARSLDSRCKAVYMAKRPSTPVKSFISTFESSTTGTRVHELGVSVSNLYSSYKTRIGGVFQLGGSTGLRIQGSSVTPYVNPKLTFFVPFGWLQLNINLNRKHNRVTLKHNYFFNVRGTTMLSSLELGSTRLSHLVSQASAMKQGQSSPMPSMSTSDHLFYKLVHVPSATEIGVRQTKTHYRTKWELLLGMKHTIASSVFIQCLFTHTIGEKTNFGLSLGLDL
ncbi:hypothetical protein SAMD00019534_045370 [Acytostelium subglobosum LB1]|uniref:hypothetical protein n=1 Tax=Acytostelium subglobosum LB1 TaxID=1410327 RepID=UPI0006448E50|nr:hypothetical protein SAMD00019534_045370 [Acytostelium subglobosum LB1]GAM21362.1 hypothetical protein SAMD00019534_045370 [Acytostelium subglobosum LB1]|eukprot:XP_012755481.1 hypothetical protein SAMD00019534_045370 [Acytostelium subglobosum LB1]